MFNEKVLLAAKKEILDDPRRLRMSQWMIRFKPDEVQDGETEITGGLPGYHEPRAFSVPPCNTVGCVAGWICVAGLGAKEASRVKTYEFADRADRLMGTIGWALYHPDEWHTFTGNRKDYNMYLVATTQEERATIVGRVIDKFIEVKKQSEVVV